MEKITYIKVFTDYLEAIEFLGDAERGRLFTALLTYAKTGAVPQLGGNERFVFPIMRAQIDRDMAAMAEISKTRSNAAKESYARRMQMQQMQANVASAANASKCCKDKDKDEDKEKDKDVSPPLIPPRGGKRDAFADFAGEDAELYATLRDYAEMRTKIKKPMTERAKQLACTKLQELSGGDRHTAIMIVEQSIANSWQGLFPLKRQEGFQQKTANPFLEMLREEESR